MLRLIPVFMLLVLSVVPLRAAVHTVGTGTPASCTEAALNTAVAAANAANGGSIVFNCGGDSVTIPITTQKRFDKAAAVYEIDGGGLITLDGQSATRILYTASGLGISFTVRNIRLVNGNAASDAEAERAQNQGGAIYSGYENTLTVDNVHFEGNRAQTRGFHYHGGGAIAIDTTSVVTISNSVFIDNRAPSGGAINNLLSKLTVTNSVFRENRSTVTAGDGGGGGGAIYNDAGRVTITDCVIIGNRAQDLGGGIFSWANQVNEKSGPTKIVNTVIAENTADHGGGLWKGGSYILKLTSSTVANNTATSRGGGISGTGPGVNFKIVNSTITGNRVLNTGSAGGIFSSGNTSTIVNSTIAYNSVPDDDASVGAAFHGDISLRNTIIAHNTGGWTGVWTCMGNWVNAGNNIQYPGGTTYCDGIPVGDPNLNPALNPALDAVTPGGTTPTLALQIPSLAINGGAECPATDQRGISRPQGTYCDIGAFELEGTVPAAFTLVSPADNAQITAQTFTWNAAPGATKYRVKITDNNGNVKVNVKLDAAAFSCSSTCSYTATASLKTNRVYTWQVKAINPFGVTNGGKRRFTVSPA